MASEDAEAALLLRLVKGLSDDEQLILMSWLLRPASDRAKLAGLLPTAGPSAVWLGEAQQPQLTRREVQVLTKLAEGADVSVLAADMGVNDVTVRNHLRNATEKLVLASAGAATPRQELTMLPVRLPRDIYDQLKTWAAEHNFPMSVIVRGLVERFLGQQRAA